MSREPRPGARFLGTPTAELGIAPHLGGNKAQILASVGYSDTDVADLDQRGAFTWAMRSRF